MPRGKGTYGSKVGRPPKKNVKYSNGGNDPTGKKKKIKKTKGMTIFGHSLNEIKRKVLGMDTKEAKQAQKYWDNNLSPSAKQKQKLIKGISRRRKQHN